MPPLHKTYKAVGWEPHGSSPTDALKGVLFKEVLCTHLGSKGSLRPISAKQLSMAATARVMWLCACVRYRPGRGLVHVHPLLYVCLVLRPQQAEWFYFSTDFRLKIFLHYSYINSL